MWCSQCQSDVATEISADGQKLLCTICGEEVRKVFAPSQHPETQSARELLARWSSSDLLSSFHAPEPEDNAELESAAIEEPEPAELVAEQAPEPEPAPPEPTPVKRPQFLAASGPATPARTFPHAEEGGADLLPSPRSQRSPAQAESTDDIDSSPVEPAVPPRPASAGIRKPAPAPRAERPAASARQFRFDKPHEEHANQHVEIRPEASHLEEAFERTEHASAWTNRSRPERRDDKPHAALQAPHFDMQVFAENSGRKPGRHESIFGQLLAYLGVALLTIGTALVVWGYFGGPAVQRYQSTGWLVSTAGQMLLFLGVVTLVSGGMQQTTHEVAARVEFLGGRMHRIEQSTQELLKGPYFSKERSGVKSPSRDDDSSYA